MGAARALQCFMREIGEGDIMPDAGVSGPITIHICDFVLFVGYRCRPSIIFAVISFTGPSGHQMLSRVSVLAKPGD